LANLSTLWGPQAGGPGARAGGSWPARTACRRLPRQGGGYRIALAGNKIGALMVSLGPLHPGCDDPRGRRL